MLVSVSRLVVSSACAPRASVALTGLRQNFQVIHPPRRPPPLVLSRVNNSSRKLIRTVRSWNKN